MKDIFYRIKLKEEDRYYLCIVYGKNRGKINFRGIYIPKKHVWEFSSKTYTSWKTKDVAIEHIEHMIESKPDLKGNIVLQECSIGKIVNKNY